jgi:hypothetical protein
VALFLTVLYRDTSNETATAAINNTNGNNNNIHDRVSSFFRHSKFNSQVHTKINKIDAIIDRSDKFKKLCDPINPKKEYIK